MPVIMTGGQHDGVTEFSAFLPDNQAAGPNAFVINTGIFLKHMPFIRTLHQAPQVTSPHFYDNIWFSKHFNT